MTNTYYVDNHIDDSVFFTGSLVTYSVNQFAEPAFTDTTNNPISHQGVDEASTQPLIQPTGTSYHVQSTPSALELKQQSSMSLLEATLADAGDRPDLLRDIEAVAPPVVDSDELALLNRLGLPIPDDVSGYDLPQPKHLEGIRFFFHATPALDMEQDFVLDFIRQHANGNYQRRELLRVTYDDRVYLSKAAVKFNEALAAYSLQVILNAALIWAQFHGANIMDWEAVSSRLVGADITSDWFQESPEADNAYQERSPRINLNGRKSIFK